MSRPQPWEPFLDRIGDTLVNLITIEVNTIEAEGMTGRKMPVWPQALLDIADRYFDYLARGVDLTGFWGPAYKAAKECEKRLKGRDDPEMTGAEQIAKTIRGRIYRGPGRTPSGLRPPMRSAKNETGDPCDLPAIRSDRPTFLILREVAQAMKRDAALRRGIGGDDGQTLVILSRIMRNSDQIIGILQMLRGTELETFIGRRRSAEALMEERIPPLPASVSTRLRKIWDINTERIVLQTLFQLDGDVVTRIAGKAKRTGEVSPLWRAHQQNLELSIGHWEKMFGVVQNLISRR